MPQMKEQQKSPEKEPNEKEANNLPGRVFRTMVIKILKKLRARMDELSENLNKDFVKHKTGHRKH